MYRAWSGAGGSFAAASARLGRWLGALFLAMSSLVVVGSATTVQAHTELVSSTPALGTEVPLTLDRVELVFAGDLFSLGSDLSVRGPDGAEVITSEPAASGAVLSAPIALVATGRHLLSYRAVGQDGHVIAGGLWFTVAAEGLPLPTAAAAPHVGDDRTAAAADTPVSGERRASAVTSAAWCGGAALGLGCLVVLLRARRETTVAARARR